MRYPLRHVFIFGLFITFKAILEVIYVYIIYPIWYYSGFFLNVNIVKGIESYIWLLVLYILLPKKGNRMSYIATQFLFVLTMIPLLSYYYLVDAPSSYLRSAVFCYIILIIIVRWFPRVRVMKSLNVSRRVIHFSLAIMSLYTYIVMLRANGFPGLSAFYLDSVYDIRSAVTYPGLTPYIVTWQAKVINPYLMGLLFSRREFKKLSLVTLNHLLLYLVTAHKSFLFSPVLVFVVIVLVEKGHFLSWGSLLATLGAAFVLLFSLFTDGVMLVSLFVRRMLFVPVRLQFEYYDFFSKNPKLHMVEGQLGRLFGITPKYHREIKYIIGDVYHNSPNMGANTAYLSDAFANFGFIGMLLYTLILGIILTFADSVTKKMHMSITLSVFLMPVMSLNDSALLTTLLTHGLLFAILLSMVSVKEGVP